MAEYFTAWAQIMSRNPNNKILVYLDLNAGRGENEHGEPSTPIKVLNSIALNSQLSKNVFIIFNDINRDNCQHLRKLIDERGCPSVLTHTPKVITSEVGFELAEFLSGRKMYPTFCFIDPYGFKGLSLQLIKSVIKDWGCDCEPPPI